MASKEMAYLNIGNEEFEIVDEAGRQATEAVDEKAEEIELTVSQLSASNLPYSSTQSTKQAIDEVAGRKYFQIAAFDSNSTTGNITLAKSIEKADSIMFIVSEGLAMRATTIFPMSYFKGGIRCGIDFSIIPSSREYLFIDFVNNTTVNLVGLSLGTNTNVYVVAYGTESTS